MTPTDPAATASEDAASVVLDLWERISAKDWAGLAVLLSPDLRVTWPSTGEVFLGPDNFVAVQAEYPDGWSIDVLSVFGSGERAVSEVEVPHTGMASTFRAASFWTVRKGLVVAATEYWVTVGAEQPPAWRAAYSA